MTRHSLISAQPVSPSFVQPAGQSAHVKDPAGAFWQTLRACTQRTTHVLPWVSAMILGRSSNHFQTRGCGESSTCTACFKPVRLRRLMQESGRDGRFAQTPRFGQGCTSQLWMLSAHSSMSLQPVVPEFVQPAGQSAHVKDPAGMFWQPLRACTQETSHEPPLISEAMSAVKDFQRGSFRDQEGRAIPTENDQFRLQVCTFVRPW